jgi:hypothetical protein
MLGFALTAEGFWSALLWRLLSGVGLAGTYMPGLKALVDRISAERQPRWISHYTASFSLGTSKRGRALAMRRILGGRRPGAEVTISA